MTPVRFLSTTTGQSREVPNPLAVHVPASAAEVFAGPLGAARRAGRLSDPRACAVVELFESVAALVRAEVWGSQAVLIAVGRPVATELAPLLESWRREVVAWGVTGIDDAIRTATFIAAVANDSRPSRSSTPTVTLRSVTEVARQGGVSPSAVRQAASRGALRGTKRGGRWLFDASDVDQWLCSRRSFSLGPFGDSFGGADV